MPAVIATTVLTGQGSKTAVSSRTVPYIFVAAACAVVVVVVVVVLCVTLVYKNSTQLLNSTLFSSGKTPATLLA